MREERRETERKRERKTEPMNKQVASACSNKVLWFCVWMAIHIQAALAVLISSNFAMACLDFGRFSMK